MKCNKMKIAKNVSLAIFTMLISLILIVSSDVSAQNKKNKNIAEINTQMKLVDSDNNAGESQPFKSGSTELVFANFNVNNAIEPFEKNTLAFRLKVPKGALVSNSKTTLYTSEKGNENGPYQQNDDPNYDYRWFIWNEKINVGQFTEFAFNIMPGNSGITDNNKAFPLELSIYKYNDDSKQTEGIIKNSISNNKFIAVTDKFSWSDVKTSISNNNYQTNTADLPEIALSLNTSPNHTDKDFGMSYAKSLNYNIVVEVPKNDNDVPLILLNKENLFDSLGNALMPNDYKILETKVVDGVTYITKFELNKTILNNSLSDDKKELDNVYTKFLIKNAKINTNEIIYNEKLPAGGSRTLTLKITNEGNSNIEPAYSLKDTNMDAITINNQATSSNIIFKNSRETGDETANARAFTKKIVKVGTVDTTNTKEDYISAFGKDTITYAFGEKIYNAQKRNIEKMYFTDEDYDVSKVYPISVNTGEYDTLEGATMDVEVSTDGGLTYSVVKSFDNNSLKTGGDFELDDVKYDGIRLVYKNIPSGFSIKSAPTIKFKVVDRVNPIYHGEKVTNKASMKYEYLISDDDLESHKSIEKNATTHFTFKNMQSTQNGRFESNKTALNLRTNNISYPPKENDVLLFTISFKNISKVDVDMSNYIIEDTYTENLSPYSGVNTTKGGSGLINDKYINAQVNSNMILWSVDNDGERFPLDVVLNESTNKYSIKLPSEYIVKPDQTLKLTYTMSVNEKFEESQTLGNTYKINDTQNKTIGAGEFWLSRPYPIATNSLAKTVHNATRDASATTLPIAGEVVSYKISLNNKTERVLDNIVIEDEYDKILKPYKDKDLLNSEYVYYDQLNASNMEMNLSFVNKPAAFDASKVTLSIDEKTNKFTIDFGTNKLESNEQLDIVYTMKIDDSALAGQEFVNTFKAYSDGTLFEEGFRKWETDRYQEKLGIIDVVKKSTGLKDEDYVPNTNSLMNGDKLSYRVDIGNYHTRPNRVVEVKTFIDKLPSNLILDEDSFKIEKVKVNSAGETEKEEIDSNKYTLSIDPFTEPEVTYIKVIFNDPYELISGLVELDKGGVEAENRLYISYNANVDTFSERFPSIANEGQLVDRKNTASVFFTQETSEYVTKSGVAIDDTTTNIDDNEDTKSYINSQANVKIYNDKLLNGRILKSTLNNVDVTESDLTRKYLVEVENSSLAPLYLSKIVDILPKYEKLDNNSKPVIEFISPTGEVENYELKYLEDSSYLNAAGEVQNRVTFTKVIGKGNEGITLPTAIVEKNILKQSKVRLKYQTLVDANQVLSDFSKDETNVTKQANSVALYLLDDDAKLNLSNGGIKANDDSVENNGANDWDSDPETKIKYYNDSPAITTAKAVSPYVDINTHTVKDLGGGAELYQEYTGEDSIAPGDFIAWKVSYGNANNATINLKSGAELVVILPRGIKYEGLGRDSSGNEIIPQGLSNDGYPTIEIKDDKQILRWKTTVDSNANTGQEFYIRCSSKSLSYNQYNAETYFIPKNDKTQRIYKKVIESSAQYNKKGKYDYEMEVKDISKELPNHNGLTRFVRSNDTVEVYGLLHIAANYKIEQTSKPSNNAKSSSHERVIDVVNRDEQVTLDMEVTSKTTSKGVRGLVLINRLSDLNDKEVINDYDRESEAKLRLVDNGNVKAKVSEVNNSNNLDLNFDDTMYKVEYSFRKVSDMFSPSDWDGTASLEWLSESEITNKNLSFEDVTAIRIVVDPSYAVEKGYKMNVTFDGKLADYNIGDKIAYSSFGFKGTLNSMVSDPEQILLEPLKIGVKARVPFDRATVTKVLNDKSKNPKQKDYDFVLNKIDKNTKDIVDTKKYQVSVDHQKDGKWIGKTDIYNLDKEYDYSVVESVPKHFEKPEYTSSNKIHYDGAVAWDFVIKNTPEKQLSVIYDANKGKNSPIDNKLYYKNDKVIVKGKGTTIRSGYKFMGWNTRKDGNGIMYNKSNNSFVIKQNTTLYAQWKKIDGKKDDDNGLYGKLPKGGDKAILLITIIGIIGVASATYYTKKKNS